MDLDLSSASDVSQDTSRGKDLGPRVTGVRIYWRRRDQFLFSNQEHHFAMKNSSSLDRLSVRSSVINVN